MYEVVEISLANVNRLYQYKLDDIYQSSFGIKGFDYPWILTSHDWKNGERILDVGAAYSSMPAYLHNTYGCESWAVDDFGKEQGESFWERGLSPEDFIAEHPEIHYVLERLGNKKATTLPKKYFNVIYSISTLEHVPGDLLPAVWQQMDSLLKPGGELIHAIDIPFPSNHGLVRLLLAEMFDIVFSLLPKPMKFKYYIKTPKCYAWLALHSLHVQYKHTWELSPTNMAINPDILTDSYNFGWNRIVKDGNKNYHYERVGSLLIHLRNKA